MEKTPAPPTGMGPAETFTGDVYLDGISDGSGASRLFVAQVRFTPGAHTFWHSHPHGQTLHCTDGVGFVSTRDGRVLVLRPGETVWTPPGEEHWHGATREHLMAHLAMVVTPEGGQSATWLEAVADDIYAAAHDALPAGTLTDGGS